MPQGGLHRKIDNESTTTPPAVRVSGSPAHTSRSGMEVTEVATVIEQASGEYQVTVTEPELVLIKAALAESERVSRFGIEVLDGADQAQNAGGPENSRLRQEIETLAMREASLRSLQKTMSEAEREGRRQLADLDRIRSGASAAAA
jgi:hypothetical protein